MRSTKQEVGKPEIARLASLPTSAILGFQVELLLASAVHYVVRQSASPFMANDDPFTAAGGQDRIWRHFQNCAVESFDGARPRLEYLVRQIARLATSRPVRVLNIGIGSGHLERTAQARGWEVHSLDPDPEASRRLETEGVHAHVGYVEKLPADDGSFDFVVASEVLEHLTDPQRAAAVREIARVLVPGGWFLGTVPYHEDLAACQVMCPCCGAVFHRWGHQASFDEARVAAELAPAFRVEKLRRTAFVQWRGRGLTGAVKSSVRWALARAGQAIAVPTIYWAARKDVRS